MNEKGTKGTITVSDDVSVCETGVCKMRDQYRACTGIDTATRKATFDYWFDFPRVVVGSRLPCAREVVQVIKS